jgi:hypothetical protein
MQSEKILGRSAMTKYVDKKLNNLISNIRYYAKKSNKKVNCKKKDGYIIVNNKYYVGCKPHYNSIIFQNMFSQEMYPNADHLVYFL